MFSAPLADEEDKKCYSNFQVIPFLVLAVGVDNIFMLVHAFDRIDRMKYNKCSERIGEALGTIGPSILLTSLSECCCFGIGNNNTIL